MRLSTAPTFQRGFTLIELSIVLVIIGLIVGGVLVGRDLISAAAVRAQISQIEKFHQAVNTFRGKYEYLPGDIKNPEAINFGFIARSPLFMGFQLPAQGDGNGVIEGASSNTVYSGITFSGEGQMFWVDLSTAKLIDGNFTQNNLASAPAPLSSTAIKSYLPEAKIGRGNYVDAWSGGWSGLHSQGSDGANYFSVSAVTSSQAIGYPVAQAGLSVQEAYNIDRKVDDGLPQSGRVTAQHPATNTWAANVSANIPGDYDQTTGGPVTSATTSTWYATDNGASLAQTCYNNGHTLLPENYSISINNGVGINCALSFRFQ